MIHVVGLPSQKTPIKRYYPRQKQASQPRDSTAKYQRTGWCAAKDTKSETFWCFQPLLSIHSHTNAASCPFRAWEGLGGDAGLDITEIHRTPLRFMVVCESWVRQDVCISVYTFIHIILQSGENSTCYRIWVGDDEMHSRIQGYFLPSDVCIPMAQQKGREHRFCHCFSIFEFSE